MNNPWNDISSPSKDVSARRIDHAHPLDLFWARDHLGHYLFIYEFPADIGLPNVAPPDLAGIQILYIPVSTDGERNRLILLLNEQSNWEIFFSLCSDLVQATRQSENTPAAVESILIRLDRWHEFLKKNRSIILPEEKILGLIGELIFLRDHLIPVFGAGQSVRFWLGPKGAPQDFNVNESAIEVKCQSGATLPYIKISSLDQLCPQLPTMYLYVITLGMASLDTTDNTNLPGLVSEIRDKLLLNFD